jgi:hypothetical protein
MKKTFVSLVISPLCLLFILSGASNVRAQNPVNQTSQGSLTQTSQDLFYDKSTQLDLKLQLLDTKLDLLDSKIKLWEAKPEELDIRLNEIDERINALAFNPNELNDQFFKIDSLIAELKETQIQTESAQTDISQPDLFFREEGNVPEFKSAIMLDPVRLFEGTFCISYERLITDKFSLGVSGLATYATEDGLTNYFFANQKLAYFDEVSDSYIDYKGESIAGGGIILQCREYLLANYQTRRRPPAGLYAAPQILYRRLLITGEEIEFIEDEWVPKVVKQRLNILSTGVIIGVRVPFKKVLFVDFFLGGHIKFSKYDGEAGLTKYKEWFNIDFSGVFPTAGIGIGILK